MALFCKYIHRLFFAAAAFLIVFQPIYTQILSTSPEDEKALTAATRGLCRVRVAMVGEIASHGDGHTLAFKVALAERLVNKCEFDVVFGKPG